MTATDRDREGAPAIAQGANERLLEVLRRRDQSVALDWPRPWLLWENCD